MNEKLYFASRLQHMRLSGYLDDTKAIKSNRVPDDNDESMATIRKRAQRLHAAYNAMDADFASAWDTQIVVSLSGGAPSAVAADIAIQRYGKARVQLVFCDTLVEHSDLYRFLSDLEQHWQMPIQKLTDGRTPYEVADDEGKNFIPNQKVATCTRNLKIHMFRRYIEALTEPTAVVLGLSADESHRMHMPQVNYNRDGFFVINPMSLRESFVFDPNRYVTQTMNIALPVAYKQGFKHNNCINDKNDGKPGGCVKFGQGDWIRMLIHYPDTFKATARWEYERQQRQREAGETVRSFLRRTVNGEQTTYSLYELKADYEAQHDNQPRLFDIAGEIEGESCRVECGLTMEDAA